MNWTLIGLFFDFVMLLLLVVTIAYAARLSLSLKRFRENRNILDGMIKELNKNVSDAEQVIERLQSSAHTTGAELQKTIDTANGLADELSLMNEAGDSLANRLEQLATRTGATPKMDVDDLDALDRSAPSPSAPSKAKRSGKKDLSEAEANKEAESFLERVFSIRDPDVERGGNPLDDVEPLDSEDDYQSEAERDLMRALQGKDKG